MVNEIDIKQFGHIGVLMGGCSSERDISLKTGQAIFNNLSAVGCQVTSLDLQTQEKKEIAALLKEHGIDLSFVALHGAFGEDGGIQAILEDLGVPYTGSDAKTSRLAMNKVATQRLMSEHEIKIPPFVVLSQEDAADEDRRLKSLKDFPTVVKPACEGSSFGISIVREKSMLADALKEAFSYGQEVLIEKYIPGREITVGILDSEALPLVEIKPKNAFFDFTAKYQKGMTEYIVPAPLDAKVTRSVQLAALKAYHLLGCRDMARIDYILDDRQEAFLLEVNTIPGFTETSLLPMAAQQQGYTFPQLCLRILQAAAKRKSVNTGQNTVL